jgi:hypothetical protein
VRRQASRNSLLLPWVRVLSLVRVFRRSEIRAELKNPALPPGSAC